MTNDLVDALIAQIEQLRDSIKAAKQEVDEWKQAASGRTVSCSLCNESMNDARQYLEERNAIWRAAYTYLQAHTGTYEEQRAARLALSKLVGEG